MVELTSAVPSFHPQLRFCSRKFLMANFQQKSQDRLSLVQTSHVIMPEPTTVTGVARTPPRVGTGLYLEEYPQKRVKM